MRAPQQIRTYLLSSGLMCLSLVSCSSKPIVQEIELRQDSFVSVGNDAAVFKKKGEVLETSPTDQILIESPNHLAVLIPPAANTLTKMKVRLKPLDHWGDDLLQYKTEILLNELFLGLGEVQGYFAEKKFDFALNKASLMEKSFPRIGYLKFLKARCLLLTGEFNKAKTLLETAMAQFPENPDGKTLYEEALKGATSSGRLPAEKPEASETK